MELTIIALTPREKKHLLGVLRTAITNAPDRYRKRILEDVQLAVHRGMRRRHDPETLAGVDAFFRPELERRGLIVGEAR